MPWSGGVYTKANNATGGWAGDAGLGIGIEAGRHDTQDNDFTTGITSCLNKDGSNAATGNLNIGNFKLTNLGSGSASTDSVTYGQIVAGVSVNNTSTDVAFRQFSADVNGPSLSLMKNRAATTAGNTIVASGDNLGNLIFWGANGSGYTAAASVTASVDGTPGASADMPGRLVFGTTSDGSGTITERGRINSSGQLLMGRTTSVFNTEVIAAGSASGQQWVSVDGGSSGTGNGGAFVARNGGTSTVAIGGYSSIMGGAYDASPVLYFATAPKVRGIGTGAGTWPMKYNTTTFVWSYDTSKRSAKENIRPSKYGLEDVLQLNPCQFNYHASEQSREDVGFIADEVFGVIPELAPCDADGEPAGVSYDRLTAVLCKAIQELNTKVEALEARIAELEA